MKTNRDKILLVALLVAVLATFVLIYFNFLKKPSGFSGVGGDESSGEFNLEILDDERFRDLLERGEFPVEVGPTGNSNPFGR